MKRFLHLTVAIIFFGNIAFAQTPTASSNPTNTAQTKLEQEFKQLIQDRLDGKRRDDKAFIERTTAETRALCK